MKHTITVRSRRALGGLTVLVALGVGFEVLVIVEDGWRVAGLSLPWPLVVTSFTAWLWVWPRLTIAPGGVRIRNHFRTIFIPWSELTDARSDLGLYLWVGTTKYFSSAPPARGGLHQAGVRRHPPAAPVIDDTTSAHHIVDVEPVVAAQMVSRELDEHRYPDRRDPVSSRARDINQRLLAEHPIRPELDKDFPSTVSIRWTLEPAIGVVSLLVVAILATTAL